MKKTIDKRDLCGRIAKAANSTHDLTGDAHRCQSFIANLCGRLEGDCPEIAKALADGAGMPHLYAPTTGDA